MPVKNAIDDSFKRFILKKRIKELGTKKGFHTELITLLIPSKRKIHEVTSYLRNEISESSNIKSKLTRKNVIDSITALLQKLKNIKRVPENGLIMFSGAIPQGNSPGTEKNELYIIEPFEPISSFKYHCASEFFLEPLEKMLDEKERYGLIVIDNKEFAIGTVTGNYVNVIKTSSSGIASKHNAGGQSQRRFERLHEEHVSYFLKTSAESANKIFVPMVMDNSLDGIFVGGAGFTKLKFMKVDALDYRLKEKLLEPVDIGIGGAAGIRAILIKVQDEISNVRYIKEKKLVQNFLFNLSKDTGLISYGEKEVRRLLNANAVKTLLLSEELELTRITVNCDKCSYSEEFTVKNSELEEKSRLLMKNTCPKCDSSNLAIINKTDIITDLAEIAENAGTKVEIISSSTEDGLTLFSTFGGIAAILRFKIAQSY